MKTASNKVPRGFTSKSSEPNLRTRRQRVQLVLALGHTGLRRGSEAKHPTYSPWNKIRRLRGLRRLRRIPAAASCKRSAIRLATFETPELAIRSRRSRFAWKAGIGRKITSKDPP